MKQITWHVKKWNEKWKEIVFIISSRSFLIQKPSNLELIFTIFHHLRDGCFALPLQWYIIRPTIKYMTWDRIDYFIFFIFQSFKPHQPTSARHEENCVFWNLIYQYQMIEWEIYIISSIIHHILSFYFIPTKPKKISKLILKNQIKDQ